MAGLLLIVVGLILGYWIVWAQWLAQRQAPGDERARNTILVLMMIIGLLLAMFADDFFGLGGPAY